MAAGVKSVDLCDRNGFQATNRAFAETGRAEVSGKM